MIHHTMGVYPNGSRKHNGVAEEDLNNHIGYNKMFRPGRALFVDGLCVHEGYLSKEECDRISTELLRYPVQVPKCTKPYI